MSILEEGDVDLQGVVLALVGPNSSSSPSAKETESVRSLRMYNLSSLNSLAKWTIAQNVSPAQFGSCNLQIQQI